jgi:hypothetical protein
MARYVSRTTFVVANIEYTSHTVTKSRHEAALADVFAEPVVTIRATRADAVRDLTDRLRA